MCVALNSILGFIQAFVCFGISSVLTCFIVCYVVVPIFKRFFPDGGFKV